MSALPRRLPTHGPVKGRWVAEHKRSRAQVFVRSNGRCEVAGCGEEAREWAHLYGRRAQVSEPWCSSPELTAALCREHHRRIDANLEPDLLDDLRWTAVSRLAARHNLTRPSGYSAAQTVRMMVDALDEAQR